MVLGIIFLAIVLSILKVKGKLLLRWRWIVAIPIIAVFVEIVPVVAPFALLAWQNNHERSMSTPPNLDQGASIAGTDADRNGVRDDIDAYIRALPDTEAQKAALQQSASALAASLVVDTADKSALAVVSRRISAAVQCIFHHYPETLAYTRSNTIEAATANTQARRKAYDHYNYTLSGSVLNSAQGDGCEIH